MLYPVIYAAAVNISFHYTQKETVLLINGRHRRKVLLLIKISTCLGLAQRVAQRKCIPASLYSRSNLQEDQE